LPPWLWGVGVEARPRLDLLEFEIEPGIGVGGVLPDDQLPLWARAREPQAPTGAKLAAIRAGAKHNYPTADIDQMLAEIDSGYLYETHR
jgi:hypothetical protein